MKNRLIFSILIIILLCGCGYNPEKYEKGTSKESQQVPEYDIPKVNSEGKAEGFAWEEIEQGIWKRTDLECSKSPGYLCVSNCYETVPICILNSELAKPSETDTGKGVICLEQSCGFDDCDIACPT